MGLFRRREKEYTLGQILNLMQKDAAGKYRDYIPVPTRPGSRNTTYWFRKEEREEPSREKMGVTNPILETEQKSSSAFEQKRDRFMGEMNGDGKYRNIPYDISRSHSTKPGRVVNYNDYQSARNYQKKYGQSR